MKVFLGGEGPDDLGDWFHLPSYRTSPRRKGIVEALLARAGSPEITVIDACAWKRIRKYQVKKPMPAEVKNVLGLALLAEEAGCSVLAFIRDQDGDEERERDVEEGIRLAAERADGIRIVGGVAIHELEAWLLALLGERRSEEIRDPKRALDERHHVGTRDQKVAVVEEANLDAIPEDARSLRTWLNRASPLRPDPNLMR